MRHDLRARMAKSLLCDQTAFVARIEQAYRKMWSAWCARPTVSEAASR